MRAASLAAVIAVGAALVGGPIWASLIPAGAALWLGSRITRRTRHRRTWLAVSQVLRSVGMALVVLSLPAAAGTLDARVDLTANRRLTLSATTKTLLHHLDARLDVTAFLTRDSAQERQFKDLMAQYRRESSKVRVRVVDPRYEPGVAQQFNLQDLGTIFFDYRGRRSQATAIAEIEITSAMLRAVRGTPKRVCFVEGHGEHVLGDEGPGGLSVLGGELRSNNAEPVSVNIRQHPALLSSCSLVVLAGLHVDLLPQESEALGVWVRANGKLLALTDPSSDADLQPLLAPWGITPQPDLVVDRGSSVPEDPSTLLVSHFPTSNPVVRGVSQLMLPEVGWARLKSDEGRGLTVSSLAVTTSGPDLLAPRQPDGTQPPPRPSATVSLAAAADASRVVGQGSAAKIERTRIVWVGDSDFATNAFVGQLSNGTLLANAASWLLLDEDLISIRSPNPDVRQLVLTSGKRNLVFWVVVVIEPLAILLFGATLRVRGRYRGRTRRRGRGGT